MTPELETLARVLADMNHDVTTAGRLASMAGLDVAQIDRTGTVADIWHNIIEMAAQDGVLDALYEKAHAERPRTVALMDAWKAVQDADKPTPKRATPSGKRSDPPDMSTERDIERLEDRSMDHEKRITGLESFRDNERARHASTPTWIFGVIAAAVGVASLIINLVVHFGVRP